MYSSNTFVIALTFVNLVYTEAPPSRIKATNIYSCETDGKDPITVDLKLNNVDSEGYKSVTLSLDSPVDLNEDITYTFKTDKFKDGDWEENVYNAEGNFCNLLKDFVEKGWKKLMKATDPPLEDFCKAKAGHYELKEFEVFKDEIDSPTLYGKIRCTINLYDKDDDNIACYTMELEVDK